MFLIYSFKTTVELCLNLLINFSLIIQELLKLRKKITNTVQVLTHLKEKLQFVQAENHVQKGRLREVEDEAAKVSIKIMFFII